MYRTSVNIVIIETHRLVHTIEKWVAGEELEVLVVEEVKEVTPAAGDEDLCIIVDVHRVDLMTGDNSAPVHVGDLALHAHALFHVIGRDHPEGEQK